MPELENLILALVGSAHPTSKSFVDNGARSEVYATENRYKPRDKPQHASLESNKLSVLGL